MLAAHCPECGAANPVSLAEPDRYRCEYCKYDGPPPAAARENLRAAGRYVRDLDKRQVQLTLEQERALDWGWSSRGVYLGLLILLTLPSLFVAQGCSSAPGLVAPWLASVLGFGPLLVVASLGGWGVRRTWQNRRQLEDACSAIAPLEPGTPARCHVCGAPLTPEAGAARARCEYCQADNVVSAPVLKRMANQQRGVFSEYSDAVREQVRAIDDVTTAATTRLFAGAVVAPLLSIVVVVVLAIYSLFDPFGPVDPTRKYLMIRSDSTACVGRFVNGQVFLGRHSPAPGIPARLDAPDEADQEPIAAEDLVGQRVVATRGRSGLVLRAFQNPHGGGNQLEVDVDGNVEYRPVPGTCLAP